MKKAKLLWYLLTIIPIALLILGYIFPSSFFGSQEAIRDFVNQFGIFSPLVFILIQVLQVVVTPFSHYAVSIAGGFIFGTWQGFIYNWIGRVIGTAIAFYLARFFGRKIIKHVVKPCQSLKILNYYLANYLGNLFNFFNGINIVSIGFRLPAAIVGLRFFLVQPI